MATLTIINLDWRSTMAKISVSKNPQELNFMRHQSGIFQEIIDLSDQMAEFLSLLYPKQITNADIKIAAELVRNWEVFRNKFISKIILLIKCMDSLERAGEEYSKLVSDVDNLNNARVIMASMLDRVRQIVGTFRAIH